MAKILYVWNYRDWGGAQIYYLSLMKAALGARGEKRRDEVSVIVPADSDATLLEYLADLGVPVEFVEPAPDFFGPERGLLKKVRHRSRVVGSERRLVTRALRRVGSDRRVVVHIDLGFWQSYRALSRLSRRAHVFVTQHTALDDPGGLRGAAWRWKGKRLSRLRNFVILASNNAAKRSLRGFLTEEKFDSIPVTYSGIEPAEFEELAASPVTRTDICERYGLSREVPLVMTLGQFGERKGCWTVLEGLTKLRDEGETLQFVWLGTSPLTAEDQERINNYNLGERFRFLSAKEIGTNRLDLLGLLSIADIFVLASENEGLPIALVEAMALGLPCIATKVGAIPEAIDHDASGVLIDPGDVDGLAEAVRTLIHDPVSRKMFGTAARAIAFDKFNQQKTAEETIELYRAFSDS